jgi:hypothetical protein
MTFASACLRLRALVPVAALAALFVAAPSAHAGLLDDVKLSCDKDGSKQAFKPWGDPLTYALVPGGSFEDSTSAWELKNGAKVDGGNESFYVNDSNDSHLLRLPRGSSATTPAVCVGLVDVTMRFFLRNSAKDDSKLKVEVIYKDILGRTSALTIDKLDGKRDWKPSPPLLIIGSLPANLGGGSAVAFRFTPPDRGGDWAIDDVYVDPRRSR